MEMEILKDIKLVSGQIKLSYTGKNEQGTTVMMNDDVMADPAWVALLLRYVKNHKKVDQHGQGGRKISLQGSCGDYPAVEARRWNPALPFNG
jgi:hypothetical protein